MTKKRHYKPSESELDFVGILICLECDEPYEGIGNGRFVEESTPCDVCFSHGEVVFRTGCPFCKKETDIFIRDW